MAFFPFGVPTISAKVFFGKMIFRLAGTGGGGTPLAEKIQDSRFVCVIESFLKTKSICFAHKIKARLSKMRK